MPAYPVAAPVAPPGPANAPRPDPGARGFRVDASELVRAQEPALINARGFVAEAGASYGPAIQALGKEGAELYQAHVDSVTKEQVLNAEASLDAARTTIAAKLAAEPNTLKWQEIAGDEAAKFTNEVLSDKDLTPAAKAHITGMYNRWQMQEVATVNLQAAQVQAKRTAEAGIGSVVDMQSQGNFSGAAARIKELRASHVVGDDMGAHMELQNQKAAKAAADAQRKESIDRLVRTSPDPQKMANELQAGNTPEELKGLTEEERKYAINRFQEQHRESKAAAIDTVTDQASSGMWHTPEEVAQYAKDHPEARLTPSMVIHAQRIVNELHGPAGNDHRAWMEANADANISRGLAAVRQYVAVDDTDLKSYNQIQSWVYRNVPARMRDEVLSGLKEKIGKTAGKPPNPQVTEVRKALDDKMKLGYKGGFGTFDNNKVEEYEDVNADTGVVSTKYRMKAVRDPEAYIRAENARVKVEGHMLQWLQTNPKATKPEILTEINRSMPTAQTAAAMDLLYKVARPTGLMPPTDERPKKDQEFDLPEQKAPEVKKYAPLSEDAEDPGPAPTGEDKTPKGSADTGASLFPADKGRIVGGDPIISDLPDSAEGVPMKDRERKRRR